MTATERGWKAITSWADSNTGVKSMQAGIACTWVIGTIMNYDHGFVDRSSTAEVKTCL